MVNIFSTTKYTKKHEDFIFPFILGDLRDLRGKNKINVLGPGAGELNNEATL